MVVRKQGKWNVKERRFLEQARVGNFVERSFFFFFFFKEDKRLKSGLWGVGKGSVESYQVGDNWWDEDPEEMRE